MSIKTFSKDKDEVLDYTLMFGPTIPGVVPPDPGWLMPGDTLIGTPTVTITGIDATLLSSIPEVSGSGTAITFWLTGGTADTYTVACKCQTAEGRIVKKSILIDIRPG